LVVTAAAVTAKVALVALAGTATEAGTVSTEGVLLERVTVAPVAGAGPERVTIQAAEVEAGRVVLAHCREERVRVAVGAVMEIARGLVEEPREAGTVEV